MNTKVRPLLRSLVLPLIGALFAAQAAAQTVTIDPGQVYQTVRGFGGMNGAGWINDLTPAQVDLAFGSGEGQIGLSILRMRIDPSSNGWQTQVATAARARSLGSILFASPWSPPAYMKSNNSLINGGKLLTQYYPSYTTHLLNFSQFMSSRGAPLYAISLQNEPDWHPDYESCDWSGSDFVRYLTSEGGKFGSLKVIVGESVGFNFSITDPVLNDATANQATSIVAGHLYGAQPRDYALARSKGKEIWMTEHFTDNTDGNAWPSALGVATELHKSMAANFNAYVWWYIRRSYGLMGENGAVSKRGYVMSQYARFVRPGSVRIGATERPYSDVSTTAYRTPDNRLVVVVVNTGTAHQRLDLDVPAGRASAFVKYSTSSSANVSYGGRYSVVNGKTSLYVDPQSIATLVGETATTAAADTSMPLVLH
ncbi:glycoside hydrolase family 30 protein [Xanthomonas maliensis]|uniref:glycoside hydrolase family 30 protein n=1 Tax=Xanthomonas maliensis TaxID=1321368 RepID=UPI0003A47D53|nr:glycoside hydrolase family 30 beta sandwich domain-containing protein [Xanthomonas maliensis]KAB7765165.1 xylanase [Xanthomonas maliensis]